MPNSATKNSKTKLSSHLLAHEEQSSQPASLSCSKSLSHASEFEFSPKRFQNIFKPQTKYVIAIESSCDDTSMALFEITATKNDNNPSPGQLIELKSFSQIEAMKHWQGVVPEIAARHHMEKLVELNHYFKDKYKIEPSQIAGVAVTALPGLLGPLLTGVQLAKTLSLLSECPIYSANHLIAHLEAVFLNEDSRQRPGSYPYLGVLLSGGHSFFALVESPSDIQILASTQDDAAGEAFDKGGKMMGLGYPAGHLIDKYASTGSSSAIAFPRGLEKAKSNPNMSFSGLKNALRMWLEKSKEKNGTENLVPENLVPGDQLLSDLCASYQKAIVDSVANKLKLQTEKYPDLPIVLGGGVACNSELRKELKHQYGDRLFVVDPIYCQDNAAMIGNLALRDPAHWTPFPKALEIDAQSRFVDKKQFIS